MGCPVLSGESQDPLAPGHLTQLAFEYQLSLFLETLGSSHTSLKCSGTSPHPCNCSLSPSALSLLLCSIPQVQMSQPLGTILLLFPPTYYDESCPSLEDDGGWDFWVPAHLAQVKCFSNKHFGSLYSFPRPCLLSRQAVFVKPTEVRSWAC